MKRTWERAPADVLHPNSLVTRTRRATTRNISRFEVDKVSECEWQRFPYSHLRTVPNAASILSELPSYETVESEISAAVFYRFSHRAEDFKNLTVTVDTGIIPIPIPRVRRTTPQKKYFPWSICWYSTSFPHRLPKKVCWRVILWRRTTRVWAPVRVASWMSQTKVCIKSRVVVV
jgi:hypothetical protein